MPYDPTIYKGAAAHYRRGRPPYSPQLEAVLAGALGLDGTGRLLDGGCGPGILTVRLAHLFDEAVGLDPDPDMLAEGSRAADEHGIRNIHWVQALAEDLPEAAPGPYRVVTFGQSLHWTDEERVAETRELMGDDYWPYGVEPNRKALETFLRQAKDEVSNLGDGYRQLEQIVGRLETER